MNIWNKDSNIFLGAIKYDKALGRYYQNKNYTHTHRHRSLFDETTTNFINNVGKNRLVYWTVTEHGFSYCSSNCLKFQKKSDWYAEETLLSNRIDVDYKKRLTDLFKPDLFGNTLNHTLKLVETMSESYHPKQVYQAVKVSPKSTSSGILDKSKELTRKLDLLKCIPYANESQYDFLKGIRRRKKLKGSPEPEVITIFDRTGQMDRNTLRKKLLRMKKEVIR